MHGKTMKKINKMMSTEFPGAWSLKGEGGKKSGRDLQITAKVMSSFPRQRVVDTPVFILLWFF